MTARRIRGGVLYGCKAGKDRTGVVSALLQLLAGTERDEIAAEYAITAKYLRERFEYIRLNRPEINLSIAVPVAEFMLTFLELFAEKYGSAADYLVKIGLSAKQLERLTERVNRTVK